MPDVGVLNLQIQTDASAAAGGLGQLADKLKAVKEAVTGLGLSTVANGLKKINEALGQIDTTAVSKLNAITAALERMSAAAGNVGGIKISFGANRTQALEGIQGQAQAAREATAEATGAMEEMKSAVQETSAMEDQLAQSINRVQQAAQVDFSRFDPSNLPLNALGMKFDEGAQEVYHWSNAVKEASGIVGQMRTEKLEQGLHGVLPVIQESADAMDRLDASTRGAATGLVDIASETQDVSELDKAMNHAADGVDSVAQSMEEARPSVQAFDEAIEFARQWNAQKWDTGGPTADVESARRLLEEFNAITNTNERIEDLTTKLGFAITNYDKEISKADPNEQKLNSLSLQINALVRQIDTLNSKSINLDFAKGITPQTLSELSTIDRLIMKREDMIRTLQQEMEVNKLSTSQIMTRENQIARLTDQIDRLRAKEEEEQSVRLSVRETNDMAKQIGQLDLLIEKSEEAKAAYNALINDPNATSGERMSAALKINKAELDIQQYNELQRMLATVSPEVQKFAKEQLNAGVSASTLKSRLFDLDGELKQKKTDLKDAGDAAQKVKTSFSDLMFGAEGLRGAFGRMFPTISGLLKRFGQLVKYRMLRAVIKQIAEGFKEGYENYYKYSEAIGSDFAPAMDSAASALLQMKNSIGAAVAPLLQSLVPILQTVVDWFIELVNYANQFLALMRGQNTWSMAQKKSTKAFDEQTKKAKKTSKALKNLLADWDELNIIQSQGGGGTGGTGTKDLKEYVDMFKEMTEFDDRVRRLVDGIKERFGSIFGLIKEIGLGILGWKVASAFSGVLGTLGGLLATGVIIDLMFNISAMFNENYLNTGKKGWLVADLLTTLVGSVLMNRVLSTVLGGTIGHLAIPLTLGVTAIAGVKMLLGKSDVSALSEEALTDAAYNSLKLGAAAGYLLYNFGEMGAASSIGGGVGTAIATFGLLIGLKATADTLNTREFTEEIVKADFLSAGLVGTGIALTEVFLGGTAVTALTLGGGAALITLGALFAVQAILTLKEKNPITWGDYKATEEEVKSYIDNYVFSGSPKVKLDLASATFEELGEKKANLEESASKMLGTLQSVKLGLVSSAEADLRGEIDALVASFKETGKEYQNAVQVAISLVPLSGGDEEGQSLIKRSGERWNELNGIMEGLGNDLAKQFSIAYDSSLSEETRKDAELAIEKISGMMTQVADAISGGQAKAKVAHALDMQMGNLSHETVDEMINYYAEQRDQLIEELTKNTQDAAEGHLAQSYAFEKLAEYALKEAGGDTTDATYQHYLAQQQAAYNDYLEMIEGAKERAEAEVDRTLGDTKGMKALREELLGNIEGLSLDSDVENMIANAIGGDPEVFAESLKKMLENADKAGARAGINDLMYSMLYDLVGGDNVETYQKALEEGILKYSDLFDGDLFAKIAEQLGLTDTKEARNLWNEIVAEMFGAGFSGAKKPEVPVRVETEEAVEELRDLRKQTAKEMEKETIDVPLLMQFVWGSYGAGTPAEAVKKFIELFSGEFDKDEIDRMIEEVELGGTTTEAPTYDYVIEEDPALEEPVTVPAVDSTAFVQSVQDMAKETEAAIGRVEAAFNQLDGDSVTLGTSVWGSGGGGGGLRWTAQLRASGGYVRSGDLVMANENGNFEMMGQMGHQPVVANNEQIVAGITRGVAEGNDDVVSALNAVVTLMQRLEQKEIVARVVPSSAMGRNNQQSAEAYSRVTG